MTGFFFATMREAQPFIREVHADRDRLKQSGWIEFDRAGKEYILGICGMGVKAARNNLQRIFMEVSVTEIINIGICGALNENAAVHEMYAVSETFLWQDKKNEVYTSGSRFLGNLPSGTKILATVAEPLFDATLRNQIGRHADLVDMEGAIIASFCHELAIPWGFLKGVSDTASEGQKKHLFENIDALSQRMATAVIKLLDSSDGAWRL